MKKIKGLFSLIRFELPLAAGICVVLGQLFALGKLPEFHTILSGFLSVFFISASILVSNDYFDIETDKINAPHRPIPSNLVTPSGALILALSLLAAGLATSFAININAFILSVILTIVGFLYNRKFKKFGLLGNLMVSFSVGMTFIYGGVLVGLPFNKIAWLFGIIAALVDLGEEIAADVMDEKGDKLTGSKSIAIIYGRTKALKISFAIFLVVIAASVTPFLLNWFKLIYLVPILLMDIAIFYSAVKLVRSKGEEGRKYIRNLYLGATFGLTVFLIMRLFNG